MEQRTPHILVIGDDAVHAVISDTLRQSDYNLSFAETGGQALSECHAGVWDLALLRVTLPDMQGPQFFGYFNRLNPEHAVPPIVMLASADELALAEQCLDSGAEDVWLYEMYSPAALRVKLENTLQKYRLQDQLQAQQHEYVIAKKLANDLTQRILPIGIALSNMKNFDRLLEKILRETKAVCNADGGTIYLREGDTLQFVIMLNDSLGIARSREDDPSLLPPALRLHDEVTGDPNHTQVAASSALLGLSINIPDIYHVKNFDFSGTRAFDHQYHYRSIACLTVPLKNHDGDVFGVLQLINPKSPQTGEVIAFNEYMQQVAEALASLVSLALNNRLLIERQKELQRFEDELQIGRQIQTSFLPHAIPGFPGWDIDARLRSAREVSGDFYDIFPLHEGQRLCFVIADVCDKGVGAALFMVLIRTLIRAFTEYSLDSSTTLRSVLDATNRYLLENHYQTNMFATLFIGVLHPEIGKLSYINNGHPAPILLRHDGSTERLSQTGPVIGAFFDVDIAVEQVVIEPGDMLFAFTDGITDARGPEGRIFTRQRLQKLLTGSQTSNAAALLDDIEDHVRRHIDSAAQFDDVTMMAIKRL